MTRPTRTMQAVLERMALEDAGLPDWTTLPTAEARAMQERSNERWNVDQPPMAEIREEALAGLPARTFVPREDTGQGAILYVHGGGWAFCSMATHERAARTLAVAAQAPVALFDYRLAPEHPFPAGLEDVKTAWFGFSTAWQGRALAFAGDSAGANLATAAMLDGARADAGLLFYGVFDADFSTPSYHAHADGPGLTRARMMRYWEMYAPEAARDDPRLAPLRATDAALASLPPLYLNAAGLDPLRSDAENFRARLTALGRRDRLRVWDGVVHGFMQMTAVLPEARAATEDAGAAFRALIEEQREGGKQ